MKASDYLGFGLSLSWGLWFIFFPNSVNKFYTWFHRGRIQRATPNQVRVAGIVWVILVAGIWVWFITFGKK